jgi:branched-chain amino acid transport system permease protein
MKARLSVPFALIGAGLLPLVVQNEYGRHLLVISAIFVLFSIGLNVIVGFLGQLSLGHSAYFGIGAYVYALGILSWGLPSLLSFVFAIIVCGLFGFFIGYPSLRLKGPYFAIVSLAFAMIIRLVVINWQSLTHGPMGLSGITPPSITLSAKIGISFTSPISVYYLILCVIIVAVFLITRIRDSRIGDAFDACRENEELSLAVGINASKYKILALVIASVFIGAAGALYALYLTYISPEIFGWYYIATPLIMVIIGGAGTIAGPIVGAVIFTILPEALRAIAGYRLAVFGLIMIAGIIFMPDGIYGFWRRVFSSSKAQ